MRVEVVTAGREDTLRAWLCAWVRSPNFRKFPVAIGDDGNLSPGFQKRAAELAGVRFFDLRDAAREALRHFFGKMSAHRALWATKPAAIAHAETRFCVWLDHDCEVTGDLSPIVEFALSSGKWFAAPFYSSFGTGRYRKTRVTQNGLCVVDTQSPKLAEWRQGFWRFNDSNDETVMPHCFGGLEGVRQMACDLYRGWPSVPWYVSPDCFQCVNQKPNGLALALDCLRTHKPKAIVRHWCAPAGKRIFRALYPEGEGMFS